MWILVTSIAALGLGVVTYFMACVLTGENLIATWWDQLPRSRVELDVLDARNLANPLSSGLIVSLTTIPSRLPHLGDTLRSLLRQTERPEEIRLCLPKWSARENASYVIPDWLGRLKSVRIVESEDTGPATKFLGTLNNVEARQAVFVVDDDRVYHPDLLRQMAQLARSHPEEIIAGSGWNLPVDLIDRPTTLCRRLAGAPYVPVKGNRLTTLRRVAVIQGVTGYVVRPCFFNLTDLGAITRAPTAVRFVDDVWISAHALVPRVVHPLALSYISYLPLARRRSNSRTSLGRNVNAALRDEDRGNSVALRFFKGRWQSGQ